MTRSILKIENFTMHYATKAGEVSAVDNVDLEIFKGESLGLVGESGCGKTSLAISIMKLLPENAIIKGGHIYFDGTDLIPLKEEEMRRFRWRRISMIFQAAMNSLNPVYKVSHQIIEAMETHFGSINYSEAREKVANLFRLVGLDPKFMDQYPHEYSGGMRQRAVIAMALACDPELIIADEPTTALDVIVQDNILRELKGLQEKLGTTMIYISHDIAVIAEVSHRIGIMYGGKLVELASAAEIFHHPIHPYTAGLMSAFPSIVGPKKELMTIPGEPPDLLNPPPGCRFHPRCKFATDICREKEPKLMDYGAGHLAACWNPLEG